jgi:hypothetical protein
MTRVSRYWQILTYVACIAAIIVALVKVLFPIWLQQQLQKELVTLNACTASYKDLSISLLQGKYTLTEVSLRDRNVWSPINLLEAERIEFSLLNLAPWQGSVSGKVTIYSPELHLIEDSTEHSTQMQIKYPLQRICQSLMGVLVSEIEIIDGKISYENKKADPDIYLEMNQINLLVDNLNSIPGDEDERVAGVEGSANVYQGKLHLSVKFNPMSNTPSFNMKASLENLDLSYLKDYFRYNGNYEVEKGMFSMLAQATGEEENVSGYVKPALDIIYRVENKWQRDKVFLNVENPFAQPFPQMSFHGDLELPGKSLWNAVALTLRNAFFEALMPVIHKIDAGETHRENPPRFYQMPQKEVTS